MAESGFITNNYWLGEKLKKESKENKEFQQNKGKINNQIVSLSNQINKLKRNKSMDETTKKIKIQPINDKIKELRNKIEMLLYENKEMSIIHKISRNVPPNIRPTINIEKYIKPIDIGRYIAILYIFKNSKLLDELIKKDDKLNENENEKLLKSYLFSRTF
jgi:predicted nuclease with TOPRIM domain